MRACLTSLKHVARLIGPERRLWLPFLLTATLEALLIGLVWLAPHAPFSTVLAPPIRYFFGDRILHYPLHLWFLYHAMKHTNAFAAIVFGAFMTGVASVMVGHIYQGQRVSFRLALMGGQVKYGRVLLIWVTTWAVAKGIINLLLSVAPRTSASLYIAIALSIILQALMVYAIPIAVYEQRTWWRALLASMRETLMHPLSTLVIVALPSLVVIAFALRFPPASLLQKMQRIAPEIALLFVGLRLVLWTIADAVMSVGVAHLWWAHHSGSTPATVPMPVKAQQRPVVA
jgi:hypothetical protein